ncbi:hypothetical protein D7B24_006846 [Verticillium nonalfalfae]|uniref:BHLH domain-containing protein n=1 Tax=Verticillium nonalfalfae TaxID=1051616 RepID=A0A3M9Y987_9PEZI|nr:uncharacterized protein D7B24_006846 [Verticillium nonalfalfae]RNJ56831.1 hypothetical protein D7B24_006846 [Verticillium nonalfalfae]
MSLQPRASVEECSPMPAAVREVTSEPERRTPTLGTSDGEPAKMAGKKRVRNFTADDRATHRIFEKNRREAFKGRLTVGLTESLQSSLIYCARKVSRAWLTMSQELATHLPALGGTDPQRLSKHVVVEESIARHKLMKSLCSDAFQDIRALVQERDELLAQVNHRRLIDGLAPQAPKAVNLHLDRLVEQEKESGRRDDIERTANAESSSSVSPTAVSGPMPTLISLGIPAPAAETTPLDRFWDVTHQEPISHTITLPFQDLPSFATQDPSQTCAEISSSALAIQDVPFLDFDLTEETSLNQGLTFHNDIGSQPAIPVDSVAMNTLYKVRIYGPNYLVSQRFI